MVNVQGGAGIITWGWVCKRDMINRQVYSIGGNFMYIYDVWYLIYDKLHLIFDIWVCKRDTMNRLVSSGGSLANYWLFTRSQWFYPKLWGLFITIKISWGNHCLRKNRTFKSQCNSTKIIDWGCYLCPVLLWYKTDLARIWYLYAVFASMYIKLMKNMISVQMIYNVY